MIKIKQTKKLSIDERCKIYGLKEAGFKPDDIAKQLDRHRSTIFRELARNSCYYAYEGNVRYLPSSAQKKANIRKCRGLKLMNQVELKEVIISYLKKNWSPEQIAGRLKQEHGYTVISHETIYAYIYDKRTRDERLYLHLSRRKRYRSPRISRKTKGPIPNRTDITERPEEVMTRKTFGHWEGDLVLFKNTLSNLITLRERKSRFMFALLNPSKHASNTGQAIINHFNVKKPGLITSLTLDNGGEFALHETIAKALQIDIFFCKPYASYQKGTVENGNRQLRRDLPRDIEIEKYKQTDIDEIVNRVNNRPLKCLGYKTPSEVLMEEYGNELSEFVAIGA